MIDITYDRLTNMTKVETSNLESIRKKLPLVVKFVDFVSGKVHYESQLTDNMYAVWNGGEFVTNVEIYTSDGLLIENHKWDVLKNGNFIEKSLWYYLIDRHKQGINSNGLILGSHDGGFGHWIHPVRHYLTNATLIDGSEKQFLKLKENYKNFTNVEFINEIVTTDGEDVFWYQGGEGYTDSVNKNFIEKFPSKDMEKFGHLWFDGIKETKRNSISINFLLNQKKYDWVHMDVESLDGDLIMAMEYKPNLIIFESMNLNEKTAEDLKNWFVQNNYQTTECDGNTISIKTI